MSVDVGGLCSGISVTAPATDSADEPVAIPAGEIALTVTNTGARARTVAVVRSAPEHLPVAWSYDSARHQPSVDVAALGVPFDIVYVNDLNGMQPTMQIDAMESGQLAGTVSAEPESDTTASIDVDSGVYLITDPESVYCEIPLVLNVSSDES